MKLEGLKKEYIEVEVDLFTAINEIAKILSIKYFPEDLKDVAKRYTDFSINSKGCWEGWLDTHGSGITDTYRKATEEEIEIYDHIFWLHKQKYLEEK